MVLGCQDKECRYGPGPAQAEKAAVTITQLMHTLGLEAERFAVFHYGHDDKEKLIEDMAAFIQGLDTLGKSPFSFQKDEQSQEIGAVP